MMRVVWENPEPRPRMAPRYSSILDDLEPGMDATTIREILADRGVSPVRIARALSVLVRR